MRINFSRLRSTRVPEDGQERPWSLSVVHQEDRRQARDHAPGQRTSLRRPRAGRLVRVEALGVGRVALTRVDALLARHAGRLDTGALRRQLDELREEWARPR